MANGNSIGSLFVALGLDASGLENGLKKVGASVGGLNLGKGLEHAFEGASEKVKELAGSTGLLGKSLGAVGPLGLAFAAALGLGVEALNKTHEALNVGAEFNKLGRAIGVSTDFIQKFNFAAKQSDIDVNAADEALKGLNTSLGLVQSGLARSLTTKAFAAVGFTPEQLRQFKDVGDFFPVLVERIAKTGSAAERAAIAKRLGIAELLPLLNDGANNFNKLAQAAQDLGIVMDAALVVKAAEAEDKLREIDDVMKAKTNVTFAEFADTLISIKTAFAEAEAAGLRFLSAITNTQTAQQKIDFLEQQIKNRQGFQLGSRAAANKDIQAYQDEIARLRFGQKVQAAIAAQDAKAAGGGGSAKKLATGPNTGPTAAGDERAIAEAAKAELQARMALTHDIAVLADLRVQEIDQETKAANAKATKDIGKALSAAAAAEIIRLNNKAADEKKEAVLRAAQLDADSEALARSDLINGYYDQIDSITAQLAATAAERAKAETDALLHQQASDRKHLVLQQRQEQDDSDAAKSRHVADLAAQADLHTAQRRQLAERQRLEAVNEAAEREQGALTIQAQLLQSQADLQTSTYGRAVIDAKILEIAQQQERIEAQRLVDVTKLGSVEHENAVRALAALPAEQAAQTALAARQTDLLSAIDDATHYAQSLASAFSSHDWKGIFDSFQATLQTVEAAFAAHGAIGGLSAAGAAAGTILGGRGGNALAVGFGAAGLAASFSAAAGAIGAGVANGILAVGGSAALAGGIGSGVLGVAALAGPLAPVIGVIAALATILPIGGKPSNNGAIANLTATDFSLAGNKRTDQTSSAVSSAANTTLQFEKALTDAGIQLGVTVKQFDLGTRDATHILLSNGEVLSSAVGDAAAAAETGLKAVLAGATYTSDAQKQLVQTMLAAGKGLDDITRALNDFAVAQSLGGVFAQALLKLSNPEAYDLQQLKAAQDARRAQVQAAADQGLITAGMLADLNAQLDQLDKAELGQVLQKYADAASQAAAQITDAAQRAADQANQQAANAVETARQAVQASFQKAADALDQAAQQFTDIANSLQALQTELGSGALSGLDPIAQAAADRANLARVQALAAGGDPAALGQLPDAIRAFVNSNTAIATSKQGADAIVAQARAAAAQGEAQARDQANAAEAQLAALQESVAGILTLNDNVLDMADALRGFATAVINQQAVLQAGLAAVAAAQEAAAAKLQASLDAVNAAANSNAAAVTATSAALTVTADVANAAVGGAVNGSAGGSLADQVTEGVVDALWQPLASIAKSSAAAASTLDDAQNGNIPLKVAS